MDRVCENCQHISYGGKRCLFLNGDIPAKKTCTMFKVNLKKAIANMKEETYRDGACAIGSK